MIADEIIFHDQSLGVRGEKSCLRCRHNLVALVGEKLRFQFLFQRRKGFAESLRGDKEAGSGLGYAFVFIDFEKIFQLAFVHGIAVIPFKKQKRTHRNLCALANKKYESLTGQRFFIITQMRRCLYGV